MAKHKRIPDVRPHHHKPYRKRHLTALFAAFTLLVLVAVEIGIVIGQNYYAPPPVANINHDDVMRTNNIVVRSSYGFAAAIDQDRFTASGIYRDATGATRPATSDEIKDGENLVSVTIRPQPASFSGRLAATQLRIEVNPTQGTSIVPPASPGQLTVSRVSQVAETFGGTPALKTVYSFTDKQGGKSYAITWSGTVNQRAFVVTLEGLVGGSAVPGEYEPLLGRIQIPAGQAVLGAAAFAVPITSNRGQLDTRYLADALSPAVVQIFHTVCGVLTVDGQRLSESNCVSFSGSGFLATATGYIATNGHVVVYDAKDAVVSLLVSNDTVMQSYLRNRGLNSSQIAVVKSDPAALAAHISKIYDLPDDQLKFTEKGEMWLVALGSDVPDLKQLVKLKTSSQLAAFQKDSTTIKQAKVIGYNYSAKDAYTTISNPDYGFSSSDVALLKINVKRAPAIPLQTGPVLRNQKITVMGFPGDAGNPLIDNTQTDVTVTDGVVSAIRQAAGGKGKLYQSDADASHGNSGGPAIDEQGRVIGLLTYRYSDGGRGNAAKSYIRDITDFSDLARAYDVTLDSRSDTQAAWQNGLHNYSRSHYSAALPNFKQVETAYPAHRLVSSYIASSQQAIKDGRDVRQLPVGLLASGLVAALAAIAFTLRLIIRHRAAHHLYRAAQELSSPDAPPPQLLQ